MIPVNSNEMVKTLGVQNKEQSEFKMNFNAQVADILSSTLYEFRDLAVIRELISNALDSHVAAKVTEPIKVTLPTKEFPTFIVEDFGVGMSKEFLLDLYSTYFFSSKRETNDEVGGFGLGSKSPFAVSSSFNVLSRKDGMETHISCSKLGDNTPKVVVLSHKPTDKPNGTTVSVPWNTVFFKESIYFHRGYDVWLKYNLFPTLPVEVYTTTHGVTSTEKVHIKTIKPTTDSVLKNPASALSNGVIYGYWYYPVSDTFFYNDDKYYSKGNLVVRVPVGKLELTPSREHLAGSQHNLDVISEVYEEIHQKSFSEFKQQFPNDLPWDLYKKMYKEGCILKEYFDTNNFSDSLRIYKYKNKNCPCKEKYPLTMLVFGTKNIFVKSSKVNSPKPFRTDTYEGTLFVGTEEAYKELSKLLTFDEVITAKEYSKYRKGRKIKISGMSLYVNSDFLGYTHNIYVSKTFAKQNPLLIDLFNRNRHQLFFTVSDKVYPEIKKTFEDSGISFNGEEQFIEELKKDHCIAESELQKEPLNSFQKNFFKKYTCLTIFSDDNAAELKDLGFSLLTPDSPTLKQIMKEAITYSLAQSFKTANLNEIKTILEYFYE